MGIQSLPRSLSDEKNRSNIPISPMSSIILDPAVVPPQNVRIIEFFRKNLLKFDFQYDPTLLEKALKDSQPDD
jgi:hypothetical protein